jgi:hypothetical protein
LPYVGQPYALVLPASANGAIAAAMQAKLNSILRQ